MHKASHNASNTLTEMLLAWLQGQTIEVPDVKEVSGPSSAHGVSMTFYASVIYLWSLTNTPSMYVFLALRVAFRTQLQRACAKKMSGDRVFASSWNMPCLAKISMHESPRIHLQSQSRTSVNIMVMVGS
jgi:hypothetical protein